MVRHYRRLLLISYQAAVDRLAQQGGASATFGARADWKGRVLTEPAYDTQSKPRVSVFTNVMAKAVIRNRTGNRRILATKGKSPKRTAEDFCFIFYDKRWLSEKCVM